MIFKVQICKLAAGFSKNFRNFLFLLRHPSMHGEIKRWGMQLVTRRCIGGRKRDNEVEGGRMDLRSAGRG